MDIPGFCNGYSKILLIPDNKIISGYIKRQTVNIIEEYSVIIKNGNRLPSVPVSVGIVKKEAPLSGHTLLFSYSET